MSATECTPSASIDDAPVKAKPMNLAMAIARLASRATTTDLVPCPWTSRMSSRRPCRPGPERVGEDSESSLAGSSTACAIAISRGRGVPTAMVRATRVAEVAPTVVPGSADARSSALRSS